MQFLLMPIAVYVAAVMETSLVDSMRIGQVAPDLLALVAVIWLLKARHPQAFLVAGSIALVGDLIAPGRLGVGMFWMLLVGCAITHLRIRVRQDYLVLQVIAVGVAVMAWAAATGFTNRLLGEVPFPALTVLTRSAAVGMYTAGVSLPLLMVVGWTQQSRFINRRKLAES